MEVDRAAQRPRADERPLLPQRSAYIGPAVHAQPRAEDSGRLDLGLEPTRAVQRVDDRGGRIRQAAALEPAGTHPRPGQRHAASLLTHRRASSQKTAPSPSSQAVSIASVRQGLVS